jgi:DNA repair photolyase
VNEPADDAAREPAALVRKSLIYKSGIGFFCINHVQGCSHGCRYPCHGFLLAKRYGRVQSYDEWCRPRVVSNALALLERELSSKRTLPERVHLCLSTDPFLFRHPEVESLSLQIIERLNRAGVAASILTKGLLPPCLADEGRFSRDNTYGISLISLNEAFRVKVEPGASPYAERIAALKRLADGGCRTRVHMEPYPTPNLLEQELTPILEAVAFTKSLFFGGWNYQPRVADYPNAKAFYQQTATTARQFCATHGIDCEF